MKNQLLSMTDYVLEQHKRWNHSGTTYWNLSRFHSFCLCYANFFKTPLELGMFVPCGKDGNVLELPNVNDDYYRDANGVTDQYFEDCKTYQQAKERVIFEGFEYIQAGRWEWSRLKANNGFIRGMNWFDRNTIEGLVEYNVTLTELKAKSLGL